MSKSYRSFLRKQRYKVFTRDHNVTAAVSFLSNKVLDKKYSTFFNKATVGYECEISVDTDIEDGSEFEIDEQRLAAEFEETFTYSKDSFLYKLSNAHKIPDILEMFDITPVYGMPDESNVTQIQKMIGPLTWGYKVVGLPMKDGSAILEEPNIDDYRGYSRHNLEKFSLDDTRLINVPLALSKAKEILNTMLNIHEMYPVTSNNNFQADTAISSALVLIQACVKNLESIVLSNEANEILARKAIYTIGEHRFKYIKAWEELIKMMRVDSGQHANFIVFDEEKSLNILNSTKYDESYGLLSPLLEWSEDGKEHFEEEFNEEYRIRYDDAWADYLTDARSGENDDNSDDSKVLDRIYNKIVEEVDSEAKKGDAYHGSQQYKGKFTVVEPDSSIKPSGAEVVSPVFTGVRNSLVWLDKVFDIIDDSDDLGTNKTTGLHVNIGTFKARGRSTFASNLGSKERAITPTIDVLKLAVLSGDHYLLEQFGRLGNTYAKSLASNIRDLAKGGFDFKSEATKDLYATLDILNSLFVRNQSSSDPDGMPGRYRTINMQNLLDKGYLEFRIAGGSNYHADKNKVHKAVYRYVQLCAVACDPDAYFKEYMIELYKRFVDSSGPLLNTESTNKEPRPKNAQEAMYYLRQWSSNQYSAGKEGLDRAGLNTLKDFVAVNGNPNQATVLDTIAGLNVEHYKNVTNNLLYAYRVLMLYTVRDKPNPKQYLAALFKEHEKGIKDYGAPKLYKNKPQWIRYFYTGSFTGVMPKELTASTKMQKGSPEAVRIADLVLKHKYTLSDASHEVLQKKNGYESNKSTPNSKVIDQAMALINQAKKEIKADDYNTTDSYWITDEGKILTTTDHERTADKYAKDRKETAKVNAWCDANDGTSVNYAAQVWGWIRIMGGARDNNIAVLIGENSVSLKAFTKFVTYLNDIPFEGCFIDVNKGEDSKSQQIKKVEALKSLVKKNVSKTKVTAMTEVGNYYLGVVGYSAQKFDQNKATKFLKKGFEVFEEIASKSNKKLVIVSGLTDLGIPHLAYKLASEKGLKTVGYACSKAKDYKLYPVDEKYIIGNDWGQESKAFTDSIDGLLAVGGGGQAKRETKEVQNSDKKVIVFDLLPIEESTAMTEIEAADGEYTNKSKSVKVLYYANRSTPQVCKPGQTVKSKAGYGKRTKIRSATPDEVAQFKQGKWLRTRESGHGPNDKGAKQSKYRPALAKKSKDAKKRKLAASEGIKYNDFLDEVFGRSNS